MICHELTIIIKNSNNNDHLNVKYSIPVEISRGCFRGLRFCCFRMLSVSVLLAWTVDFVAKCASRMERKHTMFIKLTEMKVD